MISSQRDSLAGAGLGLPAGVCQTILTKPVSRENMETMNACLLSSPSAGLLVGDNGREGERSAEKMIDTHAHRQAVHNKGWN